MLHYKIVGEGFPVVFLHGFLESISIWKPLYLETMPFRSILVDLPGHGQSKETNLQGNLSFYAKQVFEVLKVEKIDRFALVGHSMGGYIAMEMAKQDKQIDQLMLLNSNFWKDSETKVEERKRVLKVLERNKNLYLREVIPNMFVYPERDRAFIQGVITQAMQMSVGSIVNATKAMMSRVDLTSVADRLGYHLRIIQGELDNAVPLSLMLEMTKGKAYDLTILKAVGHMSYLEAPTDVRLLLDEMMRS